MSFNDLLAELPTLSLAQRQMVIRRALELEDAGLSPEEEALVEQRLANHGRDPGSGLSLEQMSVRIRSRFGQ
jgi:hypothetical protein